MRKNILKLTVFLIIAILAISGCASEDNSVKTERYPILFYRAEDDKKTEVFRISTDRKSVETFVKDYQITWLESSPSPTYIARVSGNNDSDMAEGLYVTDEYLEKIKLLATLDDSEDVLNRYLKLSLSNDGKYFAVNKVFNDLEGTQESSLLVIDITGKVLASYQLEDGQLVIDLCWSSDGTKLLVSLVNSIFDNEDLRHEIEVRLFNKTLSEETTVVDNLPIRAYVDWNEDDSAIVYSSWNESEKPCLMVHDLKKQKDRLIWSFEQPNYGVISVKWVATGIICAVNAADEGIALHRIDPKNGKVRFYETFRNVENGSLFYDGTFVYFDKDGGLKWITVEDYK